MTPELLSLLKQAQKWLPQESVSFWDRGYCLRDNKEINYGDCEYCSQCPKIDETCNHYLVYLYPHQIWEKIDWERFNLFTGGKTITIEYDNDKDLVPVANREADLETALLKAFIWQNTAEGRK